LLVVVVSNTRMPKIFSDDGGGGQNMGKFKKWIIGYFSSSSWKLEASVRIPVYDNVSFRARWDPDKEDDVHAMVEIPIKSLKYMVDQINELGLERDELRDKLEDARMG